MAKKQGQRLYGFESRVLPLCCCNYVLSKLDELMAANAATTEWEDQEETLARLRLTLNLLDLLDVTKILLELVYSWLLLQLGRNEQSLFLLDNFDYEDRPDRASLARLRQIHNSLSSSLIRIEWKSTNVLPGVLQMLEELIAAHDTIGDNHVYGSHGATTRGPTIAPAGGSEPSSTRASKKM
ncbi:hypothetical protein SELMODRAFT_412371 [Selaginella moellendorffii]|uniref:Uncharacterized protein n=1 Tax=Selaginella moellendorffii TaxID=88036 RepID=D8RKX9_SELML|nr:hypothetical protein SELMODRAFT_412371 [Selaginella moellendorffii]